MQHACSGTLLASATTALRLQQVLADAAIARQAIPANNALAADTAAPHIISWSGLNISTTPGLWHTATLGAVSHHACSVWLHKLFEKPTELKLSSIGSLLHHGI